MAALTVDSTIGIGAKCFGDPAVTQPPMVAIRREVDISKENLAENTNFAFLPIPAGFLAEYIAVDQSAYTDQAATVTFATKNADTVQLGGNFALAASSTMLRSVQPVKTTSAYAASASADSPTTAIAIPGTILFTVNDTLCIKVPDSLTNDKLSAGKFAVTLVGRMVFGDTIELANGSTPMRDKLQNPSLDNVSGGPLDYED